VIFCRVSPEKRDAPYAVANQTGFRCLVRILELAALVALAGCGAGSDTGTPPATPTPTLRPALPLATVTLSPSATPAEADSTPVVAFTPVIASETTARQIRVFTELWETVRDTYVYTDFHGLDWEAVYLRYRAPIDAGVADETFYQAMREMVNELGEEHSVFYSPEEVAEEEQQLSG
jgi:hypothetical protein